MVDQATQEIYYEQKQFFQTGETLSVSGRIEHLKKLLHEIKKKKDVICDALAKDLDKCTYESHHTRIFWRGNRTKIRY